MYGQRNKLYRSRDLANRSNSRFTREAYPVLAGKRDADQPFRPWGMPIYCRIETATR
jgi:hypothetical protein